MRMHRALIVLVLAVLASVTVVEQVSAQSLPGRRYSVFEEGNFNYDGVAASWDGEDWANIPCPVSLSFTNRVNEFINAAGSQQPTYVQLGHQKRRYYTNQCVTDNRFYWERQFYNSQGQLDYNIGTITGAGTSTGFHRYAVQRRTDGCAAGQSWCWHFRIDDVTYHTCCSGESELNPSIAVEAELECIWDNTGLGGCPAQGSVNLVGDPATAKYTHTGAWGNWSGQDFECVDDFAGMRGNWITDAKIKYGINVSMTSVPTDCP